MRSHILALLVVLVGLVGMVLSFPRPDDPYHKPVYHEPHHKGRVKMQVYRGPSEKKGYDSFAPWGFYVTQPKEDKHKYGHY